MSLNDISLCLQIVQTLYNVRQTMKSNWEDMNLLLDRTQTFHTFILQLKSDCETGIQLSPATSIGVQDLLRVLQDIAAFDQAYFQNKSVFSFSAVKRLAFSGSRAKNIAALDTRLTNCAVQLGIGQNIDSEKHRKVDSDKLTEIKAILERLELSKAPAVISFEEYFVMEPVPEGFDDDRCVLGIGAFGTTYRVKSQLDGVLYAMKRADKAKAHTAGVSVEEVSREVKIMTSLDHPNIIRYHLSFETESRGKSFLNVVMELATGGSLAEQVKARVSEEVLLKWLEQCLSALTHMHDEKKILHRDIKPENILLTGKALTIKIADLGLACVSTSSLGHQSKLGSMMYASYEKAHGLRYDGKDDVWGLGCVFAELATKKRINEWGGAIYETHSADVVKRKNDIIAACCKDFQIVGVGISEALKVTSERPCASMLADFVRVKRLTIVQFLS